MVGTGAIRVGRYQTPENSEVQVVEHEVLAATVREAVRDAGLAKADIQALFLSHPRHTTRQLYFGTFLASHLGLPCKGRVMEVVGNGMTGGFAFDSAALEIASGRVDVALALGINFETATPSDVHMNRSMRATGDVDFHTPFGFTPISWYALDAVRYMHVHGASRSEIAQVAVKNRLHASKNPLAQYRDLITLEQVLAERPIVEPLGLLEVPPRSDGAVCIALASEDVAKTLGRPYVRVRGRGFFHDGVHQVADSPCDMTDFSAARHASLAAYNEAGVEPADIDLAELYAPCTIVEVLASEALGLAPRGRGAHAAAAGETSLGGRIPICTSGGCLSRGHPPMVTPLYGLVEVADQLRGRAGERQVKDAALAVTSAELGNYNAALIHVLEGVA
jgi:acetyl-CoA acetyltransferase